MQGERGQEARAATSLLVACEAVAVAGDEVAYRSLPLQQLCRSACLGHHRLFSVSICVPSSPCHLVQRGDEEMVVAVPVVFGGDDGLILGLALLVADT